MAAALLAIAGFAAATAYVPGVYYPGETGRWMALSVLLPPVFLFLSPRPVAGWPLGAAFLVWGAAAVLWSVSPATSLHAAWHALLLAAAVAIGASVDDLRPAIAGFAVGIAINALVAAAQLGGWSPVVQHGIPAGLFVNRNALAWAGMLALVAVITHRMWWFVPFCAAAALLPVSRAALLGGAAAVVAWLWTSGRRTSAVLLCLAGAAALAVVVRHEFAVGSESVPGRLALWLDTLRGLRWAGWGPGTFDSAYPAFVASSARFFLGLDVLPGTPHNDALTLLSGYGIGALPLFGLVALALSRRRHAPEAFPALVCFLAIGVADFPLQEPGVAFVACLCLGRLLGGGDRLRGAGLARGEPVRDRAEGDTVGGADGDRAGRGGLAAVAAHSHRGRRDAGSVLAGPPGGGAVGSGTGAAQRPDEPEADVLDVADAGPRRRLPRGPRVAPQPRDRRARLGPGGLSEVAAGQGRGGGANAERRES